MLFPEIRNYTLLAAFLLFSCSVLAQTASFKTVSTPTALKSALADEIAKVETYQSEGVNLSALVQSAEFDNELTLSFGSAHQWEIEIYRNDMFAANAEITLLTENGPQSYPVPRNISYKGYIKGDPQQQVSLLVHEDYVYGHITNAGQRTYIASAKRYIDNAAEDLYFVFDGEDQIQPTEGGCGLDNHPEFNVSDLSENTESNLEKMTGLCYDVDLGIASDYSIYTDKGNTVQGVINHTVTVMMDVETDYEISDFDDALNFEIVEQVISICSDCDPWTDSTDPSDLLNDFSDWAESGGFNNTVDMGQHWSNRDFDGSTVGLAWRDSGLLCDFAYHVLQDFTSNSDILRVLTSHEIGHNLNAVHTGSGFIMAPFVSTATSWASSTVTTIDGEIDAAANNACIVNCVAAPCDPVTNLSVSNVNSTGFTISWTATGEGNYRLRVRDEETFGNIHTESLNSSGSMVINPPGWEICHRYMISVENDCGSSVYSAPVSAIANAIDQGCAEFSADNLVDWGTSTVTFTDRSVNAGSWSWNFGDGGVTTAQNPTHTYNSPGVYEVSLSVNSGVHTTTKTNYIYVLPTGEALPYTAASGGNMDGNDFGTESETAGRNSLFEKGVPSNYFNNSSTCWVTNLDGDIPAETNQSVLYSPEYDFTNVSSATLSFDLGMENFFSNAPFAVQLQFSTNNGANWTRLGSDTDAAWYNKGPSQNFSIDASIFSDEIGWLFSNSNGDTYTYNLDAFAGNSSVIFRFVFSVAGNFSSIGYQRAGAMIDNFEISATVLPVELASFEGELKDKEVHLSWETLSEINNDYFVIERSSDGRSFEALGTVQGKGNTNETASYSLIDPQPRAGINYYRLSQFDLDGRFEIFNELVAIEYLSDNTVEVIPNPVADGIVRVKYMSEASSELNIDIYNAAGQRIHSSVPTVSRGINTFELPLENEPKGIYFLRVRAGNYVNSMRFIKN